MGPRVRPKQHLDSFGRFCVHHSKGSQCFSMGADNPKIFPSTWGIWTPSNSWLLNPPKSAPQTASRSVQPFSQCERTRPTDTDRQTDRPRHCGCSNRPLSPPNAAMQRNSWAYLVAVRQLKAGTAFDVIHLVSVFGRVLRSSRCVCDDRSRDAGACSRCSHSSSVVEILDHGYSGRQAQHQLLCIAFIHTTTM